MVPEGWVALSVAEVCESVCVGIVIKPSQYYVESFIGVKAFRSANIMEGKIKNSNWVYLSLEGYNVNKKSRLKEGDVLMVRTGYPGTACVVDKEYADSNAIDIIIARPNKEKNFPEYLRLS
ncbi:hypothetical protein [Candidatus Vondammii sp. HM_W22]|uniref:hypothetical protein n=1 Tax=Candidatus Vondammii sp. HM_W22 TaxID=2687299 RepID=UPI001F13E5E2|nr:hypothetical protein [Candidatus Vondammii sp. HM_W22]